MGRSSAGSDDLIAPLLFDEGNFPYLGKGVDIDFVSLKCPLWTENKARLIQEYIKLFTFITRHGAYIDGFAAPQRRDASELCSARLVLETQPPWVRELWLCDVDPKGVRLLKEIANGDSNKGRRIHIVPGDFNSTIVSILASGRITENTATFALLDQRTFECEWETVRRIALHKKGRKIEIFYFLATGWIDRSIAAAKRRQTKARIEKWWGRDDWHSLRSMNGTNRANLLVDRLNQN